MQIILSYKAANKMRYYIDNCDLEISGLGLVEKKNDGILFVPDIFLLKQEVSSANTVLDMQAVHTFMNEKLVDPEFPIENLKLWWHSHVNMDVFWSATDTNTMNQFDTDDDVENWVLSIVGNKAGRRRARVDVFRPHRLSVDNIQVDVEEDIELEDEARKEIEEKVTGFAWKQTPNTTGDSFQKTQNGIYYPKTTGPYDANGKWVGNQEPSGEMADMAEKIQQKNLEDQQTSFSDEDDHERNNNGEIKVKDLIGTGITGEENSFPAFHGPRKGKAWKRFKRAHRNRI